MVERETQYDTALEVLLRTEPSRVAILGGGGFGKTTLARSILHDPKIFERYEYRYFLSCEAMADIDALLLGICNMLDITATPSAMLASIRRRLETSTTLLCLDNFETPWELPSTRTRTEDALASIADIPSLSLIITIRGTQRPSKVAWSHPQIPPLPTLSSESAHEILQNICPNHIVDDFTQQLLDGVDGIPLAITLISTLLRDGESSRELWTRWTKEQTAVVENGGEGRESNLNASIALSMNSPRMTKDPDSLTLLAALSLLPDGFPSASIEELEEYLGITEIRKLLRTLRAVALIKPEDSSPSPRIQMLSPILLFCHQSLSSEISLVLGPLTEYYIGMLRLSDGETSNPHIYQQFTPEIQNIHSIFQKVYIAGYQQDMGVLIQCTAILLNWSREIGYINRDTIQMALTRSASHPIPRAHCLTSLGGLLCNSEAHFTEAEKCYREAAELFKEGNSTVSEAKALHYLGNTLANMSQLHEAELVYNTSLTLYTQANDQKGQAHIRHSLGHLHLEKGQYAEAEANLKNALDAFKQMGDLVGITMTALNLANLHEILGDLAISEKLAAKALAAAKEANYKYGEGRALVVLGCIHARTNRIADARQALEQAFSIFKQRNNATDHLIVIGHLGKVYIQSDQLSAAQALFTASVDVDLDIIPIADILTTLGWVYICADHLEKAEHVLDQALLLYQKIGVENGQADALAHLGTVYFRSNRLDKAERTLNLIPKLGKWCDIEMRHLWVLGDIYIIKGQLEDAESFLDEAMVQAEDYESSYQQGNILRSIGTLNIKRGHVDLAIDKFQEALELHRKAHWVSEQATDLKRLGEAYEMSGRSEDAASAFKMADELMESVREARTLAV
jgi:tetratricopeptide (TPR) repeat protein